MWFKLLAYFKDEEGQTSTEYILLLAVVAAIVFRFKKSAEKELTGIIESVFGKARTMVDESDNFD